MAEWIIASIERFGYAGVAFLMMLESVFPPIPSELVLPFAGYVSATGKLHPLGTLVAAVVGAVAGALPWYWAGRRLGHEGLQAFAGRHGRLLTMCPEDVDRARGWFLRHGAASVLWARMVPGLRSFISMPAGVARMPLPRFLLWTAVGSAAWSFALLAAGYLLRQQFEEARQIVEWVTRAVVAALVAIYLWRVIAFRRRPAAS